MKGERSVLRRTLRFARRTILLLTALVLVWAVVHHVMAALESRESPPPGKLVEVDGKQMHVVTAGSGGHTIVLLSGLGTAAPALDFSRPASRIVTLEGHHYLHWTRTDDIAEHVRAFLEETDNG